MSKDPAFLFYTSDFLTGIALMDNEQVGKYIKLLCLQHQKGHLTEKDMLKICQTYDEDIFAKFLKDDDGLYFNQRLETETQKRNSYSESRRNNRLKAKKEDNQQEDMSNISLSYVPHMENENENRDIIDIDNTLSKKKKVSQKKPIEYSERSLQFAQEFKAKYLLPHIKVSDKMLNDWQMVWDKLIAEFKDEALIDGVIEYIKSKDKFWADKLITPMYLLNKDKQGIRGIDRLMTVYYSKNKAAIIDQQTDWNGFVNDIIKQNA